MQYEKDICVIYSKFLASELKIYVGEFEENGSHTSFAWFATDPDDCLTQLKQEHPKGIVIVLFEDYEHPLALDLIEFCATLYEANS